MGRPLEILTTPATVISANRPDQTGCRSRPAWTALRMPAGMANAKPSRTVPGTSQLSPAHTGAPMATKTIHAFNRLHPALRPGADRHDGQADHSRHHIDCTGCKHDSRQVKVLPECGWSARATSPPVRTCVLRSPTMDRIAASFGRCPSRRLHRGCCIASPSALGCPSRWRCHCAHLLPGGDAPCWPVQPAHV